MKDVVRVTEEQAVRMLSNALVLAGREMGDGGDHWPVIKSAIRDLNADWEKLKIERAVHAEMQEHLYAALAEMESRARGCDAATKAEVMPKLRELREIYDAFFSPVPLASPVAAANDEETPNYVKRIENMMEIFEGEKT